MEPAGELLFASGQLIGDAEPCGQYAFAGQTLQLEAPPVDLYAPATQGVQRPPSGPVNPGTHVQSVHRLESDGEAVWSGHEFRIPVQHHVLAAQATHSALLTP